MYHTEPPTDKTIREWYMKFQQSGCLCDAKRSGRPGLRITLYIKSVLCRVAKCQSYTEEARCLKVKLCVHNPEGEVEERNVFEGRYSPVPLPRTRSSRVSTLTRDVTATSSTRHVPTVATAISVGIKHFILFDVNIFIGVSLPGLSFGSFNCVKCPQSVHRSNCSFITCGRSPQAKGRNSRKRQTLPTFCVRNQIR